MTQISIASTLTYDVHQSTVFLFKITAARTTHQIIQHEQLTIDPPLNLEQCEVGLEGNRLHRVRVDPCQLKIAYQASIDLTPQVELPSDVGESPVAEMSPDVLPYMNPSRYCESDLLAKFAFEEFGQVARGFGRVKTICDWVYEHLDYVPGSTTSLTTAADVLLQRTGVCRDFAHLAIALCRGVGIPARYVSGYAVDLQPPDYHGFMEAFLDGHWYLFDPTRLASTQGLVRIGVGRDAADVAFCTLTGTATLVDKMVQASFIDTNPDTAESPAISTA